MKYDFKHPIWFNVVHSTKGPDGLISDLNVESEPERFWQNCVIDWYEMRQYVDTRLKIVPTPEEMLPIDPLTALNRINRPRVKLFADGRLLDEESEFIYLTEIST